MNNTIMADQGMRLFMNGVIKRSVCVAIITLSTFCCRSEDVSVRREKRFSCVPSVSNPPVIDGKKDDSYSFAMPLDGFSIPSEHSLSTDRTTIKLLHDDNFLYGYITCRGRPLERGVAGTRHDDTSIWKGDSIELLFLCKDGLKHLLIGAHGLVYDEAAIPDEGEFWKFDARWDSGIRVATSADDTSWNVEFRLPRSSVPGMDFSFNAMRNFVNASKACSWVPLDGTSWIPRQSKDRPYGTLRLIDRQLSRGFDFMEHPTAFTDRKNRCVIRLPEGKVPFSFSLFAGGRKVPTVRDGNIFSFDYRLNGEKPTDRCMTFEVADAAGIIYRYEHNMPSPVVEISPGYMRDGMLTLDGNLGVLARCYWNMRHNYPGADRSFGGRVEIPLVFTFEVPRGITVVNGAKTGCIDRNGKVFDVFEQKSKYAYDAPDWIGTVFKASLPSGSTGDIRYALTYPDGRQDFRAIPFRVISVPRAAKLKEFVAGHLLHWVASIEEARDSALSGANTFNSRGYDDRAVALARALAENGFKVRRGEFFWPGKSKHGRKYGNYHWLEWSHDDEKARAKDIDGKYIRQNGGYMLSPAYRGRLLKEDVAREAAFCRKAGIDYFAFDIEDYAYPKGELGDFREEVIAAFVDRWRRAYPGVAAPDPRVFERKPTEYPEAHRLWVDTKCGLWGGMIEAIKMGLEKGIGRPVTFTEWSFNRFRDIEGRNHCMRDERFFRCFDLMEMDIYSSLDRFLRFHEDVRAAWKREFPGLPFKLILTPSTHRLGEGQPSSYYWSSAPKVENEVVCAFKEAATLGAKGMLTYRKATIDAEYLRQFAEGVNLIAKAEDVVLHGVSRDLKTDAPSDLVVTDKFGGKNQTWRNQKRVFARANTFGERTLVSVSSYREPMPLAVCVECPHEGEVTVVDLESGETVACLRPGETELNVTLDEKRRCRLFLMTRRNAL